MLQSLNYRWTTLWPGLATLWLRGEWAGLATAVTFGMLVNLLLTTTFLWPSLLGSGSSTAVFNIVGWLTVLCFWGVALVATWHRLPRLLPGADSRGNDTLLLRAQTEYLKGNWYNAERLLLRLLEDSPRDADAHLLMASLYRRTRRKDEAQRHLYVLEKIAGGTKWLFEIDCERALLAQMHSEPEDVNSDSVRVHSDTNQKIQTQR
jgi:hypothetical protein